MDTSGRGRGANRLIALFHRSARSLAASLALAISLIAPTFYADTASAEITLVLGGGGAAGTAHVGVIAELERNGLRPDCIVGTSMGALVGGLYAAGYSPEELERIAAKIDWDSVLAKSVDRSILHPVRRESRLDLFREQGRLPIGIGEGGARVSGGLFDDVKLGLILRELTEPVVGVRNFDRLPIRFRAVAADLETGEAVVLGGGDLATALRASMSIPGLFAPVELNSRLLVDGGIADNLPIETGRAMCGGGGDVIVSYIPPAKTEKETLRSLTGALGQTLSLFIHRKSREQIAALGDGDLLITSAVESIGVIDFDATDAAIDAGRIAAAAASAKIRQMAEGRAPLTPLVRTPPVDLRYDRLVIENNSGTDSRIIRARLGLSDSGVVSPEDLKQRLFKVYGLDVFTNVTYETRNHDGETVLVVSTTGRDTGKVEFRAGVTLRGDTAADGNLSLLLGASYVGLNSLGARIDVDASIGATDSVRLRFEQPLDYRQELFVRPSIGYIRQISRALVPSVGARGEFTLNRIEAPVDFLWAPGDWGRIGLSVGVTAQRLTLDVGPTATGLDDEWEARPFVGPILDIDTLDNVDLPTSGEQLSVRVLIDPTGPGDRNFGWGSVEGSAIVTRSFDANTFSAFGYFRGEIDAAGFSPSTLGGFQRLSGYNRFGIADNVAALVGARYYRTFDLDLPFTKTAFAGGSVELGGVFPDWGGVGWPDAELHVSAFAGFLTPLGPLVFAAGLGEGGEAALHLTLGQRF